MVWGGCLARSASKASDPRRRGRERPPKEGLEKKKRAYIQQHTTIPRNGESGVGAGLSRVVGHMANPLKWAETHTTVRIDTIPTLG